MGRNKGEKMKIKPKTLTCKKCGWTWIPRKDEVRQCPNPKCRSVWWDKESEGNG